MIGWWQVALTTLLLLAPASPAASVDRVCAATSGLLAIQDDDSQFALHDPGSGSSVTISPGLAQVATVETYVLNAATVPGWSISSTSSEQGYRLQVTDQPDGTTVFDTTFEHRIELATSAHSRTGRFTVFLQANNQASEVTIFDAQFRERRELRLHHHATLAAYAIGLSFSSDEACLAVSLERAGGPGPETWLIDPLTGAAEGPMAGFVRAWLG